jgi:hypothetical protein
MAYTAQPRNSNKDHWSLNLRVKRPGRVPLAALVVAVIQTLLLAATASSLGTGGGLYGCTSACGTADEPATPPIAIAIGIAMLILPLIIGALCQDWRLSVGLAVLPVIPAFIIASNTLLTTTNTIVPPQPAKGTQPAVPYPTSHFSPPFWLDPAHLTPLLFSLALFALLGWLGWVVGSFFRDS